jgi:hypothetical protein
MKKLLALFMAMVVCFSFAACKDKPDNQPVTVEEKDQAAVNPATLAKLKNSTPEETASTFLRSLCENDYDLFLLVSKLSDSVEVKDRFNSMRVGYDGKNYEDIPVTLSSISDTIVESEQYDKAGNKETIDNKAAILKIFLAKNEDGTFYFKKIEKDI